MPTEERSEAPDRRNLKLSRLTLLLAGISAFCFIGRPAHAQSGPLVYDYRGADGTCCSGGIHPDNGHDGQWGQRDFIQTDSNLDISAQTPGQAGILVNVGGGNGGDGKDSSVDFSHWGGNGGGGRNIDYTIAGGAITSAARGIDIYSIGGNGGLYANANGPNGGYGIGGDGHLARITLSGTEVVGTGFGVAAQSWGGNGSDSALAAGFGGERDSGHGGNAGEATVHLQGAALITVLGPGPDSVSAGVGVLSEGGGGGTAQHSGEFGGHSNAGRGGDASAVTFTSSSDASVVSQGDGVYGVIARSLGGNASTGNYADTRAADGGNAGSVTVDNGGAITTQGNRSIGIFALSQGGQGGNGGDGSWASGHPGGAGGTPGAITISNSGVILTGSDGAVGAKGIVANVVGGEGGQGGGSGEFGHGGNGGPGALAGQAITITNDGSISTAGNDAAAVVANSAGGGGGLASPSNGIIAVGGGHGGAGGSGGSITMANTGSIDTSGDNSAGVTLQSIGGGGGVGGDANATGVIAAIAIGGDGGAAGDGGQVQFSSQGSIATRAGNASAVMLQSIGGGGGSAGSANAVGVGVGLNVTLANGGRGGSGGSGGAVSFTQQSQGTISTLGAHSNGVLAQSIGGGGGHGGMADSRSITIAPPTGDNPSGALTLTISNGGAGQAGGNGGTVALANLGAVTTQAEQSHGMLAQSIGQGGGQGGGVLAPVKVPVIGSTAFDLQFSVRHGGQGGQGGSGGRVTVSNSDTGTVAASGTGSAGIVAQSIGGGGGNGGIVQAHDAYSFNDILGSPAQLPGLLDTVVKWMEQGPELEFSKTVNLSVQVTTDGSGGAGGGTAVDPSMVLNTGTITTQGDGSAGIVAQSVGGGGGRSVASGQNLEDAVEQAAGEHSAEIIEKITSIIELIGSKGGSALGSAINVQNGGLDGAGGAGGSVMVDASASTSSIGAGGRQAPGILAQSVGGGGGISSVDQPMFLWSDATASLALGAHDSLAGAGAANTGGAVGVSHGGTIATQAGSSAGIMAQSVGGGGGLSTLSMHNASLAGIAQTTSLSVALGNEFKSAVPPGGGHIAQLSGGAVSVSNSGRIGTQGMLAPGVFAQSIGGGGGTAIVSTTATLAGADVVLGASAADEGGFAPSSAIGDGGSVAVTNSGGIIATEGALAFGVLAQSVGGGGGYFSLDNGAAPATAPVNIAFGSSARMNADGGGVTVTQDAGGAISTSGVNAHGIVAQSVGGGGGMAGLATQPGLVTLKPLESAATGGQGGAVSLSVAGSVATSGDGAIGILAQSVGGGGGLAGDQSSAQYTAGIIQSAGLTGGDGDGGSVSVAIDAGASIQTSGANAPAILAMSVGGGGVFKDGALYQYDTPGNSLAYGGPVGIDIGQGARVAATGANTPALVALSNGANGGGRAISINLDSGALLSADALSGTAILAVSPLSATTITNAGVIQAKTAINVSGPATVNNSGTVAGDVLMGNGGVFNNQAGANLYSGSQFQGALSNAGTLNPGGPNVYQETVLTGTWNNTGTYAPDLDFAGHNSDFVSVSGPSTFSGTVAPVLRNPVKDVWLEIAHFGALQTSMPAVSSDTPLFQYVLKNNGGQGWSDPLISVDADFSPSAFSISSDRTSVAGSLQALWDQGDKNSASLFDKLTGIQTEEQYRQALNGIAHDGQFARAANQTHASYAAMNRMMSCPAFVGESTMLREGDCTWARMEANWVRRDTTSDDEGYRIRQKIFTVGAQRRIADDWFLGGSLSYTHGKTTSSSRLSGDSETFSGGLALKYNRAPWQLAAAVHGGVEKSRMSRGTPDGAATSKPKSSFVAGRLRIAYEFSQPSWYLRPYADFDVHHIRQDGYQEQGASLFRLKVRGNSSTSFMVSPMLEAGGRKDLADGSTLRAYVAGGMSFLSGADVVTTMQLSGLNASPFSLRSGMPSTYANLAAGLEYATPKGMEFKTEYSLRASGQYRDQSVTLRAAYRF